MPQLNPGPWLMILIFAWTVLLVVIPPKILAHTYPNEPTAQNNKAPESQPWNLPWS
uniref:ATP synthase complex subunit 8 n=1 Tax=Bassozetus zenkevitchi TaxID=181397 RepID=Q8HMH8_BASZE|nr:ATP synthase F0 subunit 8 [Bassozetus zenkevitchi]BAC23181.1 ATPase subunit 8 [Bassozetus zenkevitchi]